jgi:catechol 2,3-dioxygenase-like lactoylglutathione lyase family enzyme
MSAPSTNQLITFLMTDQPEESARFYEEVLGLELALAKAHCRIYRVSKGAFVALCSADAATPEPKRTTISIQTDQVDAWFERLSGLGCEVDGEPRLSEQYGIYHFFTWDPNGYSIEFQHFEIPEWDHDS